MRYIAFLPKEGYDKLLKAYKHNEKDDLVGIGFNLAKKYKTENLTHIDGTAYGSYDDARYFHKENLSSKSAQSTSSNTNSNMFKNALAAVDQNGGGSDDQPKYSGLYKGSSNSLANIKSFPIAKYNNRSNLFKNLQNDKEAADDSSNGIDNQNSFFNSMGSSFSNLFKNFSFGDFFGNTVSNAVSAVQQGSSGQSSGQYLNSYGTNASAEGINIKDNNLGVVSSHFESSGNSLSVGHDSNHAAGNDFGKYQFTSRDSLPEFLDFCRSSGSAKGKEFAEAMYNAAGGNKRGFYFSDVNGSPVATTWKRYMSDPEMQKLEQAYAKKQFYDFPMHYFPTELQQMINGSRPLQEMLFSTGVQHGPGGPKADKGAIRIFTKSFKPGMTPDDLVKAVYADRATRFSSSSDQASIRKRFAKEQDIILSLLHGGTSPDGQMAGVIEGSLPMSKGPGGMNFVKLPPKGNLAYGDYPIPSVQDLNDWKISDQYGQLRWPAQSNRITSPMGPRNITHGSKNHAGIDIHADAGAPVYAALSGTVVKNSNSYGEVAIDHGNGLSTRYLHMSKRPLVPGTHVNAGQVIGGAGSVGVGGKIGAFPNHLHFEVRKNGIAIDPEGFFYTNADKAAGSYSPNNIAYDDSVKTRTFKDKLAHKYLGMTRKPGSGGTGAIGGPDMLGSLAQDYRSLLTDKDLKNYNEQIIGALNVIAAKQSNPTPAVSIPQSAQGVGNLPGASIQTINGGDSSMDNLIEDTFQAIAKTSIDLAIGHAGITSLIAS